VNIAVFCYDDINNPRCGGGGALRELMVHRLIASRHSVRFFSGNFKGATDVDEANFTFRHIGLNTNYLFSRISFAISATIRSLFSDADIIAIPYSVYAPVITFLVKPKKTVVLFFHITGLEVFKKYGFFGIFPWMAEKLVLSFGRHYITLTDSMASMLVSRRKGVTAKAGYVSFDTSLLDVKAEEGKFILCFGRIDVRMKGLDILMSAFEKIAGKYPEYRLVIAGRGQESDVAWVNQRIKNSTYLVRIQCLVNVDDPTKKRLLMSATFVCMPSRFEGWNIAAVEAAACSKATLGTDIHGLKDAIKDGETGILVHPEDVNALAEKMALLLSDAELRKTMGKQGREWARNFTWEKVAGIQEAFYREVYASSRKPI
jgi:glycosyltransferase involved in cell wall biosynthesis